MSDHEEVIARTVYLARCRAARVAEVVGDLLGNVRYGRAAEEVAAAVRGEDGARAACDAIEACLSAKR